MVEVGPLHSSGSDYVLSPVMVGTFLHEFFLEQLLTSFPRIEPTLAMLESLAYRKILK